MRKWICICLLFLITSASAASASEPFTVAAKAAVLIDGASGKILFGQNENEPLPMASTTKIMTALIALENTRLDEMVTAGKNASGVEGTSIYLSVDESLSMEHMLYGLMLRSGNDAAVAIAEHVAGSVPAFAEMMNAAADELDADAHFVNPHGLPAEGHKASALGLARIMRKAMSIPEFRTITGTSRKIIPWVGNDYSRVLENKNKLLTTYEGATGGKTGYTKSAGRCLVFSAERDGTELIGVVLNCPTWFDTATMLLDYGFENFRSETALSAGQTVGNIKIKGGDSESVSVVAAEMLATAVPVGSHYTVRYQYFKGLSAPIYKGQILGKAEMLSGNTVLATTDLIAAEEINAWNFQAAIQAVLRSWTLLLYP